MHQLEQFGTRLLFRWVHVLVALHDIDIDSELVVVRRQGTVALSDSGITFGTEVPHRCGILDQEREAARVQKGQHARGVGADGIAHTGVQAVVHVGQHQIEIGLGAARLIQLGEPFLLHAVGESGAEIEKGAPGHVVGARGE